MRYHVVLQRLAAEDLDEASAWAVQHAPETAARWLQRFHAALQTLSLHPQRCPLARENGKVDIELRELHFGKRANVFRVIFTIDADTVRVLRIRRAQRRWLTRSQIEEGPLANSRQSLDIFTHAIGSGPRAAKRQPIRQTLGPANRAGTFGQPAANAAATLGANRHPRSASQVSCMLAFL